MKLINPFSNLHLSEQNQSWTLPLIVIIFSSLAVLTQYVVITTWMLMAVPDNSDAFFANPSYAFYGKVVFITIAISCIVRLFFVVYDFYRFNQREGNKISANYLYWIFSGNLLSVLLFILFAQALALFFHFVVGWDRAQVYEMITNGSDKIKSIYHSIPNLIQLPGIIVAVIVYLVLSFLLYAKHYIAHISRVYWLLSHRPHHVTTALTNGTGFLADMQFAISWVTFIIEGAAVVMISKLMTTEQEIVMICFFVFAVFYQVLEMFNHAATFYMPVKNHKLLNALTKFFSCGPYHILHHSAHEDHAMVNLGGNSGIWDFIFGTYCDLPEQEPKFGLTHQPALNLSATAVVLGGYQQILYELKYNKDFMTRLKIIFGDIYYKPPVTKDFLIDAEGGFNVVLHLVKK